MKRRNRNPFIARTRVTALTLLVLSSFLGACAPESGSTNAAAEQKNSGSAEPRNPALAAKVPQAVRDKGTIVVAADPNYPPNEFVAEDGRTVIGMDADLAAAIGSALGLKVEVVNVAFDAIIPGLASGKYDIGMSSFTDTREREKAVDFVTYFKAGTSFFIRAGDGPKVGSLDDLCGVKVAVFTASSQQSDVEAQAEKCKAAGKPVPDMAVLSDTGPFLALDSRRVDVTMADSPVAAYQVLKSNGKFVLSGTAYGVAPYGIAIPKGNGMAVVIRDAMNALIADGTYMKVLTEWGVQDGAIDMPAVNGAIS